MMRIASGLPHRVAAGLSGLGVAQVLSLDTTATIAATIQQVEGYYPGSLAYRNNNPGNLVYVGQSGATLGAGGFAKFPTYQDGLNALYNQIQIYAGRGLTISDMMNIYAPASAGNDPTAYANTIANALGVSPDTSLLAIDGLASNPPAPDLASLFDSNSLNLSDPSTMIAGGLIFLALVFVLNE